jgi:hypothetical protein
MVDRLRRSHASRIKRRTVRNIKKLKTQTKIREREENRPFSHKNDILQ